jgi:hypothetical protein
MKMKLRFLVLVLIIGLMATITFGGTVASWIIDPVNCNLSGNWIEPNMWQATSSGRPPILTTGGTGDEIKLNGRQSGPNRRVISTINTNLPNFNCKITVAGGTSDGPNCSDVNVRTVLIQPGAQVDVGQFQVGHGNSSATGWWGKVVQTGGVVSAEKLMISTYGTRGKAHGEYIISGGTLRDNAGMTTNTGRLLVGAGITTGATTANNEGILTIVGADANISMKELYVGGYSTYVGTGTINFKIKAAGVSEIKVSDSITLPAAGNAILNVRMCETPLLGVPIVLVENTGTSAVAGTFKTINGLSGAGNNPDDPEKIYITLGACADYWLDYFYNASNGELEGGNDIALIPEPATIALLSLGLIAIRRKK